MGVTLRIAAGRAKDFTLQILDEDGTAFTALTTPFLSTDTLSFVVWPGDELASLVTIVPEWTDADTGTVLVPFAATDTTDLTPGVYRWELISTRVAKTGRIDEGQLRVSPVAGTGTVALAFTTYADLQEFAPYLDDMLADSGVVGFNEQQARATNRLIDALVTLWKPQTGGFSPLDSGYSAYQWGSVQPSRWLREQLVPLTPDSTVPSSLPNRTNSTANLLVTTVSTGLLLYSEVIEICARWAIAEVCRQQAVRDENKPWRAMGAENAGIANTLFRSRQFEIDLQDPQTGVPSIVIDGGCTSLR